jgi:hypothetical protein
MAILGMTPAGYTALEIAYGLEVLPNWHRSYISTTGTHKKSVTLEGVEETYTSRYQPGDSLGEQLEFALKYDGTNLGILAALFEKANPNDVLKHIRAKPTGKYARRIWFLYEFLTGTSLPLPNLTTGNYVDLLDAEDFYTTSPALQVRRQRIHNNLLGDSRFCPTIRRTERLKVFETADLSARCREVVSSYSTDQLRRALSYLYTKETKSSFELEHIKPSATRTERFVSLLQSAEQEDFCTKERLISLQNQIVDPRFRETDYRSVQNYVGESLSWMQERVHYACPKPENTHELMAGLLAAHEQMTQGHVAAVAHAAAIAYGLVFLHPFEDGNGRLHRLLIHNLLSRLGFTPEGIMFPISAAMLKHPREYDASLEAFSRPLMKFVDYSLDNTGRMSVSNDTARFYRYIDFTPQVEALYSFIERTIETELVSELSFLEHYDTAKISIQEIVDMPDRLIDLAIRLCIPNNGRISQAKRASQFESLSDEEMEKIEAAVRKAFQIAD